MHMFEALFDNVVKTDSGVEFSFEDIRFNLTNSQLELDYEISAMENYFTALDRLGAVCASIESYDGNLDTAVREFIDHNGEISAALGIALEDDQNANGQQVQEQAKKNIFARMWDAIKRFFTAIWNKIVGFFRWIGNGFKKLPEKIDAAQKAYNQLTPEERAQFLKNGKVNVTPEDIRTRLQGMTVILQHLSHNAASGDITKVMETYYHNPSDIYSKNLAEALSWYNISLVNEAGRRCEDVLSKRDASFVNMIFKTQVEKTKNNKEAKPLAEMGWNDNTIQELFVLSQQATNAANQLEELVSKLEKSASGLNATQMEEKFNELLASKSGFLYVVFKMDLAHPREHSRIKKAGAESYRKGIVTICNIYKACLYAIKNVWVDDNRLLDLFRKSPAELQGEGEQK